MGSDINFSVGGLVWVRRRNGNWWPGRIMGMDELPESSSPTPRSGTPVKLLGKEDASVDWYNLEKTIRVKDFRCGEYDEVIEKAKSHVHSPRKLVKHARREDAILQALEIENAQLGKEPVEKVNPQENEEEETDSDTIEEVFISSTENDSELEASQSEDVDSTDPPVRRSHRSKRAPRDSEEESEGVTRMRGLNDVFSSLKRKRSRVDFLKRKNRRRTLTKVLGSTEMVSIPITLQKNPRESNNQKKNVFPEDGLYEVPLITEEEHIAGLYRSSYNETGSTSSGYVGQERNLNKMKVQFETSKWKVKGKRTKKLNNKKQKFLEPDEYKSWSKNSDLQTAPQRSLPLRQSRFMLNPKYEDFTLNKQSVEPCLYEVNIEVKASYRPHDVPYVSLMSKLSGRPIIGHPLMVKVCEDEEIVGYESGSREYDEDETSCDVSETSFSSGGFEMKKQARVLAKKTRKLSSITGGRKGKIGKEKKMEIKEVKGPVVACVPVKLVFSRINAGMTKRFN